MREEIKAAQQQAYRFAQKEVLPRAGKEGFKRDLVLKMGQLGLFGCAFPARYGGSDSGFLAHSVVWEEISRADSGLRPLFNLQALTVPYTMMEWGLDIDTSLRFHILNRSRPQNRRNQRDIRPCLVKPEGEEAERKRCLPWVARRPG